jgi:hypothetical protein
MAVFIYTIGFYFILLIFSTNIVGFIVNGFYDPILDVKNVMSEERLIERSKMDETGLKPLAYVFLILGLIYLFSVYYYFNLGLAIVALSFMLTRIPDVRFEIRTNTKINKKNIPKNVLNSITTLINWLLLPAIYLSLKYLELNNSLITIK